MSELPEGFTKGPGAGLTFLYYFAGTALVGTFLATQSLHLSLTSGVPSQLGSMIGLVGGLVGTYFNASKTLELPTKGKKKLLNQITPILTNMGYTQTEAIDSIVVFQRSNLRSLFSGKIYLYVGDKTAIFVSRATHIRALAKQLL